MKYLKYLLYILLALSSVIIIAFYTSGYADGLLTLLLNWSIVLMLASLVGAVIMPIFFSSGKGSKSSLIKLGVVVVICVVSYVAASGDPLQVPCNVVPTETDLKLTDTGLVMTIILFVVAVLAILSGGLINTIRNR